MAAMIAAAPGSVEVQSMAVSAAGGPAVSLRALIGEAIRRLGQQKVAAADMRMDPSLLSRQLASGHLTVERLELLGPAFCRELGRLLVEQFGPGEPGPDERRVDQALAALTGVRGVPVAMNVAIGPRTFIVQSEVDVVALCKWAADHQQEAA